MTTGTKSLKLIVIVGVIITLTKGNAITEVRRVERDVEGDPELEAYLREAIENFREQMKHGIEAIKMPVLDPLVLKHLDINVREDAATLDLNIHEITVRDLSKFNLNDLQPDLEKLFLKINLTLPEIRASGQYKINGKIVKIFPLYGEGSFTINVTRGAIAGLGQLELASDTLQLTTLSLDLRWEQLSIELENLLGGSRFSQVLQKIIPQIGKGVFEQFKPQAMGEINSALKHELNKELRKPKVKEIIKSIFPGTW